MLLLAQEQKEKLRKRMVKKVYINKGKLIDQFPLKPHEQIFCSFLDKSDELPLSDLAKKVYDEVNGFEGFGNKKIRIPLYEKG